VRILVAGATGVLGRATLPHLRGHEVVGTTRDANKLAALSALGARGVVCDVYEPGAFARVAEAHAPEVVVNLLTDLAGGPGPANNRMRLEGGPVVSAAARAAGARRLVVESLAFGTTPAGAAAVEALEADARASGLEVVLLRFGLLWGPGTWDATPSRERPPLHVDEAGRRAAALVVGGAPGTYVVVDP
jgi:nucleoside-diphosphate-sugar epimerase